MFKRRWHNWRVVFLHTNRVFVELLLFSKALFLSLGRRSLMRFPMWSWVLRYKLSSFGSSIYNNVATRVLCCNVRKVLSLQSSAILFKCVWLTGVRKLHSYSRKFFQMIQYDFKFDSLKINPVLVWRLDDVLRLVFGRLSAHNALLAVGYRSVGCEPCTRPVKRWEKLRAGRWWWEHTLVFGKECGLHFG
ncbi:phosphoadenosine phosphosulfate reductase family protein [Candidatus Hodgkinia cicadicola]